MKIVKIFSNAEEKELNDYLEENKEIVLSLNIFPDKTAIVLETDSKLADRLGALEEPYRTAQIQIDNATLSISLLNKQLNDLNSTAVEVGSEKSAKLVKNIEAVENKKEEYQSVIETQTFYLEEIDKMIADIKNPKA